MRRLLPPSFRLAPLMLALVTLSLACLPGARAPNVAPRGTLNPNAGEASLTQPEGPFGVVFAAPRGRTTDPSEVTLVFNRPMRPLDVAGNEAQPPATMKPAARGRWSWVGTTALVFAPAGSELPRATEFTVEVPAGTRALDGSTMDKPYVLRFSTVLPAIESANAGEDADAIEPTATFKLRFNQPIDEAEVTRTVTLSAGAPVEEVTAAKSAKPIKPAAQAGPPKIPFDVKRPDPKNDQLVELVPKAKLPVDTAVRLDVDPSLRGREGPLPADQAASYKFHTYGP